jgi:hypothetical protein
MNWEVPRIWEGGDVWILGGGPSVTKQFDIPDTLVQEVMNGVSPPSIYSPYMEVIHKKHVIGINAAYLIGTWIDMVFFGDNKFFLPHKDRLAAWPGLKVTCHDGIKGYDWVKFLGRDGNHPKGITPNPNMISWNAHSGGAAISVAANAGAKRIILLGFDMTLNGNGEKNWHKLYAEEPTSVVPAGRRGQPRDPRKSLPFHKHLLGFPYIAKDARMRGIEIINISPDSAIVEFPKMTLKEFLNNESTNNKL